MKNNKPLDPRPYKIKRPKLEFFCPLCKTQRGFAYNERLSIKNYLQIFLATLLLYPILGIKIFVVFLFSASIMELIKRLFFKNEIPCPHCGFDASWYRKNLNITRKKVEDFWENKKKLNTELNKNLNV